ncbi:MAG: hypothetical protein EOP86_02985 [Verrucomicrobiaceae bacterium]|nr:MAG: hypothetical protein EOP86_02985 [Verrucomicrobiaceae bacterium]
MATPENVNEPQELDAGMMVRRALFLLMLIGLTAYFLGLDFRGLSTARGIEQAQVAREIADGHGISTRSIRPIAWRQVEKKVKEDQGPAAALDLRSIPDTYFSPLGPMLNSLVLGTARSSWELGEKQAIYTPDYLIAGTSMVFLLASIGISYLLISRIFDTRIGGVTALLMLFSELLWRFSQTGLPQMLMLFLFSFGTYFLYKAIEAQAAGRKVYLWIALTGGFFGLLAMSHWLTLWIFIGLVIFSAVYFNPRGVQAAILLGIVGGITMIWMILNQRSSGHMLGAAQYTFFGGLGGTSSEEALFRDLDQTAGGLNFQGFLRRSVGNSLAQITDLYGYLGGIVAAPLFFLSLLHPFRRREIADFRWVILGMWFFAVIGMTLYGLKPIGKEVTDSNNLHILFIPLMTGYGLAFLSVLWNRLNLPIQYVVVRNGHFILAVLISILPFSLKLVPSLFDLSRIDSQLKVQYPNYVPQLIKGYADKVKLEEIIVSDIPWAVAWYGNRTSIWLPKSRKQLQTLIDLGKEKGQSINSILLSPEVLWTEMRSVSQPGSEYFDWRRYIMFYGVMGLLPENSGPVEAQRMAEFATDGLPFRHFSGLAGSAFGNLYLFMTEIPIAVSRPRETGDQ